MSNQGNKPGQGGSQKPGQGQPAPQTPKPGQGGDKRG